MACGILVPQPGVKPMAPALEGKDLTTDHGGNPIVFLLYFKPGGKFFSGLIFFLRPMKSMQAQFTKLGTLCLANQTAPTTQKHWAPFPAPQPQESLVHGRSQSTCAHSLSLTTTKTGELPKGPSVDDGQTK